MFTICLSYFQLEEKSGQTFQHNKWWSENNMVKTQDNESRSIAMEFQQDIANFEKMKTDIWTCDFFLSNSYMLIFLPTVNNFPVVFCNKINIIEINFRSFSVGEQTVELSVVCSSPPSFHHNKGAKGAGSYTLSMLIFCHIPVFLQRSWIQVNRDERAKLMMFHKWPHSNPNQTQ